MRHVLTPFTCTRARGTTNSAHLPVLTFTTSTLFRKSHNHRHAATTSTTSLARGHCGSLVQALCGRDGRTECQQCVIIPSLLLVLNFLATLFIDTELTFDNIKAAFAGEDGDVIHLPQEWAGTATIEVYMLSNLAHASDLPRYFNQVGNFTGSELYGAIYQALLAMCADADKDKDKEPKCDNSSPKHKFPSKWPKPGDGMAVYRKILIFMFFGDALLCHRCEIWDNNGRVSAC